MKLYKNQIRIRANNDDKFFNLEKVIFKVLIAIKNVSLNIINSKRGEPINEANIKWKLVVPAIFSEKSKI